MNMFVTIKECDIWKTLSINIQALTSWLGSPPCFPRTPRIDTIPPPCDWQPLPGSGWPSG